MRDSRKQQRSPSLLRGTATPRTAVAWCMRCCRAAASSSVDAPFVVVAGVVRNSVVVVFALPDLFGSGAVDVDEDMPRAVDDIARMNPY